MHGAFTEASSTPIESYRLVFFLFTIYYPTIVELDSESLQYILEQGL